MIPAYFNWSGGKDSTLALYHVLREKQFDIKALVTTVNAGYGRISMHGVRRGLLREQARHIGLPVNEILLPDTPDMETYEAAMQKGLQPLLKQGIGHCVFGDIFLEDLRKYREEKLLEIGVTGIFPLWGQDTRLLAESFVNLGFKAIVVCTDAAKLDVSFAGRIFDHTFLNDLPAVIDPCGENGEFHTFVFDGPVFREPVKFRVGETVTRSYADTDETAGAESKWSFHYTDLLPADHFQID